MESKGDSPPPGFKEELEDISNEPRNWKGILIALLVIVTICSLISLAIVILSPHLGSGSNKSRLKLEDVFDEHGSYPRRGSNATWITSKEILYRDMDGTIYLYDVESNWKTVLASNYSLTQFQLEHYSLSENKKYILLVHDISSRNSYSFTAKYEIYDTAQSLITHLNGSSATGSIYDDSLQFASWGPKGSQLLYIHRNNLYYLPKLSDRPTSQPDRPIQLTTSGREGLVWNGIPDLVNEEFVLKQGTAFWWHPAGDKLVYATYDNRDVDMMPVVVYGPNLEHVYPSLGDDDVTSFAYDSGEYERGGSYPRVVNYPYPKPLRRNSQVSLWLIFGLREDPTMRKTVQVKPPPELLLSEHYLVDVTWVDDRTLSVLWSRRSWNTTFLTLCTEEKGWNCENLHVEHLTGSKGWLSVNKTPLFSADQDYFFMILPVADGTAGTFDHVKMIHEDGKSHFLTHGQFVVTKLLYYRQDIHTLYYQATSLDDPGSRHIWSVVDMEVPEPEKRRMTSCISCSLPPSCLYNDAKFSPNGGNYVILECKGPGVPRTELRRLPDNILVEELNLSPSYISWMESKVMPRIKVINVPLSPVGPTASAHTAYIRVELLLPPNLVESEPSHHFPLVISLDGRPETQVVNHEHKLTWGHYLVSKRDYIHVSIDGRGSGFQGDKMKHKIYQHLGEYQANDVDTVVKYLKDNLAFIDKDKVAIYGKGMGGHLVVNLISHFNHFTCGVAVAPVTSWRNFASAFVEKYMGLPIPQDNYVNYDKTDLVRNLGHIKDKQLLIAHGTGDRIVSIQHSMLLMKALTNHGVSYKIQMYPDGEHSLHRERYHLHQVMEEIFAACFKVEDDEDDRLGDMPLTKVIKGKFPKIITGSSGD